MHINNGTAVDAGWTKQIAWSPNGSNWSTLNKLNLTVIGNRVNKNADSPVADADNKFLIAIYDEDTLMLRFYLNQVENQAGWTNDTAGLQQALDDLATWIAA